jgi:transposase
MVIRYKVTLTQEEKNHLLSIIKKGSHTSLTYRNAYVLLNTDVGDFSDKITNLEITKVLKVSTRTIDRVKKRFVEEGFDLSLKRKVTTRIYDKKVDGDVEAHLISIACSEPPKGFAKWSLRLLADKMVTLNYIDSISHETVRTVLKKRVETLES